MSGAIAVRDGVAQRSRSPSTRWAGRARYPVAVALLAAVYYGAAKLGYVLEVAGPVAAIVWLPVGVGIAALYLGGIPLWPGVLLGDLLANDYGALPLGTALAQTCGNLLEVLLATVLLRRLVRTGSPLESVGGVMRMVAAIAAGTALSATIGSLAQMAGGVIGAGAFATVWRTWWLGDTTGALVIVPLAIAWAWPARELPERRALEAVLLFVLLVALTEVATTTSRPLAYLVFPALIWAALRFGQRGATAGVAIAVGLTVWNAAHYLGAFVFHSVSHTVINTQLFVAVAALTTLCLAAVASEREAFGENVRASRARIVETSETERRRLLRNLHDGVQQRLTALAVHLRLAAETQPAANGESAVLLERAGTEVTLAIEELRELAHGLHPALLAKHGLGPALEGVAARATVPVTLVELPLGRYDQSAESTAFYVVAEAVANAQKHARGAASVRVKVTSRHDRLDVEIADDGSGGAAEAPGSGLQGLRDRVEAIGGSFAVESAGRGTRITARIPAPAAARRPS